MKMRWKILRGGVPKEFWKYLEAYIWLKGEPKFGTHVLSSVGSSIPDDITGSGDVSVSEMDSDYTAFKESGKRQKIGREKAKKFKKAESARRESASNLTTSGNGGGHLDVIDQNLKQLNNYTELFLKQQTEGIHKFMEIEAMKHASETDMKEYFKMVTERAMIMHRNRLLESKIKEQEFLKRLDSLNNNNMTIAKHQDDTNIDDDSGKDDKNKGVV
mmetsp:Transcript_18314/g.35626  ORF Transcript_18314/g.35626 Transcript_18314/m.35626 type:complete len:216 (+) Transcript_18314:601-1248(+)